MLHLRPSKHDRPGSYELIGKQFRRATKCHKPVYTGVSPIARDIVHSTSALTTLILLHFHLMKDRNTRNRAEEAPIRGPQWTNAKLMKTSMTIEARKSVNGMFGLQKHFDALVDNVKKGIEEEAAVKVDSDKVAHCQQKSPPTPKKHAGAFAFLNGRKDRK
jgi:hypothetical protein